MFSTLSYGDFNNFVSSSLSEGETNREASTFIVENYDELLRTAHQLNCDPFKCEDLIQDLTESILKSERNGNGYNMNKGNKGVTISVAEFVYARLKLYSKNLKYRKPTEARIKKASGEGYELNVIASSSATDDVESMTACQVAYNQATSYDDMSDVDELQSFEEELNYVLSFDKQADGKISNLIKNLDIIKNNTAGIKDLSNLFDFNTYSSEFREALTSVIRFSGVNNKQFKEITARVIG